jgi:bifunctional isochorismate lyase/aryl carrier protein
MLDMKSKNIHMFIKGTSGPLVLDELDRSDADLEVVKKRYSMFFQTDLDALLQRLGMDQIILAGVNTQACIRVAAIDAYQKSDVSERRRRAAMPGASSLAQRVRYTQPLTGER